MSEKGKAIVPHRVAMSLSAMSRWQTRFTHVFFLNLFWTHSREYCRFLSDTRPSRVFYSLNTPDTIALTWDSR